MKGQKELIYFSIEVSEISRLLFSDDRWSIRLPIYIGYNPFVFNLKIAVCVIHLTIHPS